MFETNFAAAQAYVVCMEFKGGTEPFACESYRLLLSNGFDIAASAHALTEASPYWNKEIPEPTRSVFFAPLGDDDSDPPVGGAPAGNPASALPALEIGHFLVLSSVHLRSAIGGLAFARACGCQYVLFDCDATPVADLPLSRGDEWLPEPNIMTASRRSLFAWRSPRDGRRIQSRIRASSHARLTDTGGKEFVWWYRP